MTAGNKISLETRCSTSQNANIRDTSWSKSCQPMNTHGNRYPICWINWNTTVIYPPNVLPSKRHGYAANASAASASSANSKKKALMNMSLPIYYPALKIAISKRRSTSGKKFGTPPNDLKARSKQIRFMMSRGFSSDTINTLLSQAGKEET